MLRRQWPLRLCVRAMQLRCSRADKAQKYISNSKLKNSRCHAMPNLSIGYSHNSSIITSPSPSPSPSQHKTKSRRNPSTPTTRSTLTPNPPSSIPVANSSINLPKPITPILKPPLSPRPNRNWHPLHNTPMVMTRGVHAIVHREIATDEVCAHGGVFAG